MIVVGLTGGIGSGKSIIGQLFICFGIPLFNSDNIGKAILNTPPYKNEILHLFGEEIMQSSGNLDRKKIANRVFGNPELLNQLNAIIHPAVGNSFKNWIKNQEHYPYVIKETAILFESGIQQQVDYSITITAPKQLRINRVMQRSQLTAAEIEARMKNQWCDEEKVKQAHFVIVNDETALVIPQALEIHKKLIAIAAAR